VAVFDTSGEYTEQVLDVVADIPPGRVMTYGDVAWVFGRPGARAVGMVLRYHGSGTHWWRVIRAGGHPPTGHEDAARAHYEAEGTPLLPANTPAGYRIDLAAAAWDPQENA
jgi:alkylated DNA nucleotide flippase Atl1